MRPRRRCWHQRRRASMVVRRGPAPPACLLELSERRHICTSVVGRRRRHSLWHTSRALPLRRCSCSWGLWAWTMHGGVIGAWLGGRRPRRAGRRRAGAATTTWGAAGFGSPTRGLWQPLIVSPLSSEAGSAPRERGVRGCFSHRKRDNGKVEHIKRDCKKARHTTTPLSREF